MLKGIAIIAVCAGSLLAQTTTSSNDPNGQVTIRVGSIAGIAPAQGQAPLVIAGAFAGPLATIAGAPYSAQTSTERVQVLADGNRIDQTTTGSVARDSQGRVRREETLSALAGNGAETQHLIFIDDPVAGVHWNLNPQTKTAFKMSFVQVKPQAASVGLPPPPPPPGAEQKWFFTNGAAGATFSSIQIADKNSGGHDADTSKTDLGTQTIGGVPAQGTRITRTIPAGSVGNDLPIVITTETWYSPDLRVLVMSKTSDPRMGDTSYALTNIQRSEPPASLFQVPDDYTVKDQPALNVGIQEKKNE
jgi:hypothetical protein